MTRAPRQLLTSAPAQQGAWPLGGLRLASVLLVLVQLAGLAHLSFARHGVCWEHGVVVELDGAPAGASTAEPLPTSGLDRAALLGARGDAHPHCPALWLHRQLRPAPMPEVVVASSPALVRRVARPSVPPARWAVLHRAPKQSPPV